jgi:hypothetical protein
VPIKPKLTTQIDANATNQLIRICSVTILANLIKIQRPEQEFAVCKLQALEQLEDALSRDWL